MNDAVELFQTGGWVMWPIAGVSLAIAYLAWDRVTYVWRATRVAPGLASWVQSSGAVSLMQNTALDRILSYTFTGPVDGRYHRFREAVAVETEAVSECLGLLGAFVVAAPLLGLLGTVTGMIEAFNALQTLGTSSPQALSAGISQALFTTQAGLIVALPGMYAHRWLKRRERVFEQELARVECELAPAFQEGP